MYREQRAMVRQVVRRSGVLPRDIDDAVQDVFIVVHRRWDELANMRDVHPWVYGVALRVSCNYRRARRRWSLRFAAEHADLDAFPATRATLLDDELTRLQRQGWLGDALAQLDDKRRAVVVLTQLESRSAMEVSRLTGLSPNTVSSRLRAALVDLRRIAGRDAAARL